MTRFLLQRLVQSIVVIAVMSFVIYGLLGLMPGDPIDLMITSNPEMTSEDAARLRSIYGLDRPILERYGAWANAAVQGDFGYSRLYARPVLDVLGAAMGRTLVLVGAAFALSLALGLAAGVAAAAKPRSQLDYAINFAAFAGISIPPFWLALLLIIVFAVIFGILPAGGMGTVGSESLWDRLSFMVLPVAALTISSVGAHTRYVRSAMIETLRQDFIRTARAKGLTESRVLLHHALRGAMIPVVTVAALDLGYVFSGAMITETIFAYPGMGKLIYDAIMGNDYNLALVALLFATLMTLAGNLMADIAYGFLDPRISFRRSDR